MSRCTPLAVDPALADIEVQSGIFALEANSTSLGDPAKTLTLRPGTMFQLFNTTNRVNKVIISEEGAIIRNGAGAGTIIGPINLASSAGYHTFDMVGTSLTLSNTLTGGGLLYKATGGSPLILSGNSPDFAGGGFFNVGTVTLSGTLNNALGVTLVGGRFNVDGNLLGAGVTNYADTVLAGSGTISGAVDVGGALMAGNVGVAGTLTTGELTLQPGVMLTNDLALATTVGSGVNDLYQVNGNLNLNGNDFYINRLDADLSNGIYTLATYTGNLNGALGAVYLIGDVGAYTLTLSHVTAASPKRIDLIVTGGVNLPPDITLVLNNGQMTLSWPVNYTGWRL